MQYRMDVCRFWCPYPGGNNGKPILRNGARRPFTPIPYKHPAPTSRPPPPPISMLGRFVFLSGVCFSCRCCRGQSSPTLKWGLGGRGGARQIFDVHNQVSRYFRPGMDPKLCKHPFYTTRCVTEVAANIALESILQVMPHPLCFFVHATAVDLT